LPVLLVLLVLLGLPVPSGRALVPVMKKSVADSGTNYSVLVSLEQKISFR
jgi:hypothetical protein